MGDKETLAMTMQIKSIYIYSKSGDIRTLDFALGQVNIITGEQGTGKSALIPIIEYCMGRKSPDIKLSQEIQDSIAWFAVLYQFDDMQLLVAKPPLGNSQSQSEAYLRIAPSVGVPSLEELVINSNDDAIRQEISQRLGIRHHVYPDESRTTEDYEVDISHARFSYFKMQLLLRVIDISSIVKTINLFPPQLRIVSHIF